MRVLIVFLYFGVIPIFQLPVNSQPPFIHVQQLDAIFSRHSINDIHAIGIVTMDSMDSYYYGEGTMQGQPLDHKTLFPLGSSAEVFTALLLADQVNRSGLPENEFIESFLPNGTRIMYDHSELISLTDLATHTSGFTKDMGYPFIVSIPMVKKYPSIIKELSMYRILGYGRYSYSSINTGLLAYFLSNKSFRNYDVLLKKNILNALGMSNTYSSIPEWYTNTVMEESLVESVSFSPQLHSTLKDMMIFMQSQLQVSNSHIGRAISFSHEIVLKEENFELALGWKRKHLNGDEIYFNEGDKCLLAFSKTRKKGIVVLSSKFDPTLTEEVLKIVLQGRR